MSPKQVVWVSDLHVGSTIGLSPCHWPIDEKNIHHASKAQLRIYKFWTQFWKRRKEDGRPIVLVLGGDLVDGNHHGTHQIWTLDEITQSEAAVSLLKPIVDISKKTYLLKGTTAHSGQSGRFDDLVAKELGVPSYYHLRLKAGGVLFDLAHHGVGAGKRAWNMGNAVRNYGRSIMMSNVLQHRPPPQVVIRGHTHVACHETVHDGDYTTEVIVAPSWQLKTEHSHKISSESDLGDVGGVIVGVDNGRITDIKIDMMQFQQSESVTVA